MQRTRGKVCGHRESSGQGKRQHGVQAVERPAAGILRVPEPQGQPARGAGSRAHDEDQGRLLREQADLWSAKDPGEAARRRLVDQSKADSQADGQGRPDAGILAQACADDRIRPPGLSISQPAQAGFQRRAAESDMGVRFHLRVHRRRLVVFVYLH